MISNDVTTSSSGIQLFANFDSGNMLRYERVTSSNTAPPIPTNPTEIDSNNNNQGTEAVVNTISHPLPKHDIEFNVWTRRDCEGTAKVNGNRSWFYFGVKGGHGKCLRFNIMNLNRQARLFEMGMLPVFRTVPGHEKWARIYIRPCWEVLNEDFKLSFIHRMADAKNSITYFAFCFPHSYDDMQTLLNTYDTLYNSKLANHYLERPSMPINGSDIYYHRETLCYSCDKNKLDLLTITSYKGITKEREHHFDRKLFPDCPNTTKRPHQFRNKRVFFLSSRVHPGETPAAYVFLGFLDFILKPDDPRARILRDLFIFKLVPILNPDGVQLGHYRTDQFGVNLNRMYLDPDFDRHPSIYAAKSLIAYHHINNCISPQPILTVQNIFKDFIVPDQPTSDTQSIEQLINGSQIHDQSTARQMHFQQETKTTLNYHAFNELALDDRPIQEDNRPFFLERAENGLATTVPSDIDDDEIQRSSPYAFHYMNENLELRQDLYAVINDDDIDEGNLQNQIRGNEGSDDDDDMCSADPNDNGAQEPKSPHLANPDFLKISPYESGVAYYMDLHGHASKKGCFIYGNHLPDDDQHTNNILYAKLISLNSPHFDYDNCNFTIKNMYMKDRREGLSKEGSGRVALNKHFGILHSYTLECSYAVGKSCNAIAPAENEAHGGRVSPPTPCSLPPKFTIEHYRDVGKACALAAIDILPGRNPFTRVTHSTFKNLQTLRDYFKHQIRQQRNRMGNTRTLVSQMSYNTVNRGKQQQYLQRVTQTYRTTNSTSTLSTSSQQQQSNPAAPATSSAPPSTMTVTRTASNNYLNRTPGATSNQQAASRAKLNYDNRRYSTIQYKHTSQPSMNSNLRVAQKLSPIEAVSLPTARLVLQQPLSPPSRLQQQQQQSTSSPSLHYIAPSNSALDPLVIGRNRPTQPLPPPIVRNTIHRNTVSLNAFPTNQQNKTTASTRGRLQNSITRGPIATRSTRMRQQSLTPFDLQQSTVPYSQAALIYRHPMNTDPPTVFFE
ncbi:unnamed protein product [Adineta ricciae]|uniref:tubulin-glutamate carboxypeptidase n=1 Tax=Adineta ricciae TaxID=249248 RepID=A0A815N9E2_ADIRI|nr:unnamed protein product [Adineta ricciae]